MSTKNNNSQKAVNKQNVKTGNYLIGFLSFLAILFTVIGISLGYYAWLELNKKLDNATVDRHALSHDIATIDENAKLQSFKKQIHHHLDIFENKLTELSQQLDKQAELQEKISEITLETVTYVKRSQLIWGLKEVEHVLRMANHRLHIENDISGTIATMNAADLRLEELNDLRLSLVRESISKQISKLKNFPYPDLIGIRLQIDTMLVDLRSDLINSAQTKTEMQNAINEKNINDLEISWWKSFINNLKDLFSKSVTMTDEKQKMKLFVALQEKQQIYEYLRMKLLSAKYAITNNDDKTYHRELEAALAWLEGNKSIKYNKKLMHDIRELNSVNIEPELPNIKEPQALINDIVTDIENS